MKLIKRMRKWPRAIRCFVADVFASRPIINAVEVRRAGAQDSWEGIAEGSDSVLFTASSEERAIAHATEILSSAATGGEVVVVNDSGNIGKRVWVLFPVQRPSKIERKNWRRHRLSGWKHFCSRPANFAQAEEANEQLIELLQALIGPENVGRDDAYVGGALVEFPDEEDIFVRCSRRELARLKKSERWFRLLSEPECSERWLDQFENSIVPIPRICTLRVGLRPALSRQQFRRLLALMKPSDPSILESVLAASALDPAQSEGARRAAVCDPGDH